MKRIPGPFLTIRWTTEQGVNTRNQQERGKSSDITNEEPKGNRNGWDSSRGVEMFGRRRDRHDVGSDERDIRALENTNRVER